VLRNSAEDPSELFSRIFGGDSKYIIYHQDERRSTGRRDQHGTSTSTQGERNRPSEPTPSRRSSNNQGRTPNHQQKKRLEEYERQKRENHEVRIQKISSIILSKIEFVVKHPDDRRELQRFEKKIKDEAESMKLESFGERLLHTIGESFVYRSKAFRDAVPIITPLRTLFNDWGQEILDVYGIVSTGIDASKAIAAMKKVEGDFMGDESVEQHEDDKMTEEKKNVVGKVLGACWKTTVKEFTISVGKLWLSGDTRVLLTQMDNNSELCYKILYDEDASSNCLHERATAFIVIGEIFMTVISSNLHFVI
jgi:hypothetical protein